MRLIDTDKLLKEFEPDGEAIDPITVRMKIVQAPTAYDVDKVVEQLEEKSKMVSIPHHSFVEKIEVISTKDVIDIVKVGGLDEDM